jgi:hypothetical protein
MQPFDPDIWPQPAAPEPEFYPHPNDEPGFYPEPMMPDQGIYPVPLTPNYDPDLLPQTD